MSLAAVSARTAPSRVDLGYTLGLGVPTGVVAERITIRTGTDGAARLAQVAGLPFLVVDGVVMRNIRLGQRTSAVLHGAGDVLAAERPEPEPFIAWSRALTPSEIVVLDSGLTAAISGVPALLARLVAAVDAQVAQLGLQTLLGQLVSISERLEVLLPELANRWGTVTANGVMLPAFLSHTVLAALIGVRRPSLTTALIELHDAGRLRRLPDRRWQLAPELGGLAPAA